MREGGLERAIGVVGGVGALARAIGVSQPSVSTWRRIPAERVLAVETVSGVPRTALRPDLYPVTESFDAGAVAPAVEVDEIDALRGQQYGLLAVLLGRAPTREVLDQVAGLKGDASPLGLAHIGLAEAARQFTPERAGREFFDLFIGLGQGELLPYASYYLTGFLQQRPLALVRADLSRFGLERADNHREPEDHAAILCEVMAGLCSGAFGSEPGEDRRFFERHLKPWAARFFADLETAEGASFYRAVGRVGRVFVEIEAEAFGMDD